VARLLQPIQSVAKRILLLRESTAEELHLKERQAIEPSLEAVSAKRSMTIERVEAG